MQMVPSSRAGARMLVGACLTWVLGAAQAGLFEDDEARKAILDLRAKVNQNEEAQKSQLSAAVRQLTEQVQQLQRGLLESTNQNERLRADMARLRGEVETAQREIAELQRHQRDMSQQVDDRVRRLEPQPVTVDGREFVVDADERRAYDDAMSGLRAGDFDKASAALAGFLKRYPTSGYTDSVRYWLANAQYGRREYREAVNTFRAFLAGAPEHARAPEALLAMANCYVEMKDTKAARRTLDDLIKQYPNSDAAAAARERLSVLK